MHNHRAAIIVGAGLLILAWVEPIALARGADTPPASAHARAPRTLPAIVRPARDVILGAPQDGVLLSVLVSEGERVAQGQVLASLDDRAARAAVALAESEAARTADLRRAESDLAHARTRLERLRTSAQGGGASSMEIDDAQRAVDRAEADRDSAIERIESARQRLALERARLDQHAIAAPFATRQLADLGARVIKIEAIDGDPYRQLLTRGLLAVKTNAGKESICLDLKSVDGRAIAHDLVRRVDVLVHNYRPGVPERLGIDYASARALNPRLIWVSANGYGPDGPSARRPVTHPVAGAAMGGAGHQGAATLAREHETLAEIREGARQLMRANEANPDPNTSVVLAAAVSLGLLARERFGSAGAIYTDMLTANAWANADDFLDYAGKKARPRVDEALLGFGPTYRLYEA
ncbi:MAG TPA: hypothetical protein DEB06_09575, partial [Phycisphaerales bacterium]|nr:hypothetical protein [Phycisphaerales bacterium]